ncbi:MAG TPA: hypothetical protein VGL23_23940 [Chloroflexota bacterium]
MLVIALASFGAIVLAWLVAPEGKAARTESTPAVPARAVPLRA